MCCKSRGALSRAGILWGLFALVTLLVAFVGGSWLYTKEPVTLPNSNVITSIRFRIGLWRVCPSVRKVNSTIHVPSPACSLVKYSGWRDITHSDLGLWLSLDFAQVFISQMRSCTVLIGCAIVLLLLAFLFGLIGHCNGDNKILVACGLYILAALSLGTGLVVFASTLSETLIEATQYHKESLQGPDYDYHYGWCFFTAGAAFIMTKMAAAFSLSGYINKFPSVDEMVRQMVPGAERKMREYQQHSKDCFIRHSAVASNQQYDFAPANRPKYDPECGPLLSKTPPDVCTTNKYPESSRGDVEGNELVPVVTEASYHARNHHLAGQTVPIKIKNNRVTHHNPMSYSSKYGTMPHSKTGFLGGAEVGSCSSSGAGYCSRSKTLQHQRPRKKCVKIETFQSPDAGFGDRLGYSGSAV